jgi:peptidyl-prolyl cis-trans isomerase B (cyclophilin B)
MAVCASPWRPAVIGLAAVGIILGACLTGCNRQGKVRSQAAATSPSDTAKEARGPASLDPRYKASFADATRKDPLADWEPPATTLAGKSVGSLYDQVTKSWDGIHFVTDDGQRIVYHAVLETEEGTVEIELRPDWAPNHVRNFIALAQAGYYDSLVFQRIVNQASKKSGDKVELIEGGGPTGAGERDQDGIGYWLKDEFNAKVAQEEGVVGAGHGEEADSAACKFYVLLCRATRLDGNYTAFGKVVQGLDVARKIAQEPVQPDEGGTAEEDQDVVGGDYRPVKPVVIRKVTITTKEVDKSGPGGDN